MTESASALRQSDETKHDAFGYFDQLKTLLDATQATDRDGRAVGLQHAMEQVTDLLVARNRRGGKIFFAGNGGSAGICSHMAIDFAKAGKLRALACNDPASLTCLGNDYGYEQVFAKQIEMLAVAEDSLIAISSSGQSPNIVMAAAAAKDRALPVITLTGFQPDNPLRQSGWMNFYIGCEIYGLVEAAHLTLCSALLDMHCGNWGSR